MVGIDVSSHDNFNGSTFKTNTESAYQNSDFVIVKATQGTTYVNPTCDGAYQRAKKDGKCLGVYHYAAGKSATAEATYFYNNIKGYIGEAIPCVDWESGSNSSWGSTTWVQTFVNKFYELSKVWCMIYVQASAISQVKNCVNNCALWVAGYPDNRNSFNVPNFPYNISPWSTYTVWQFSSSNEQTDRNTAKIDAAAWKRIAQGDRTASATAQSGTATATQETKTVDPRESLPDNLKKYTDVEPNAWYIDSLSKAVANGYLKGYSDTLIGPNDNLTRGQAVCMIANASKATFEHPYSDVTASPYYYDAVVWAKENKIVSSDQDNFRPDDACTRAEFCTMLYNWKANGAQVNVPTSVSDWDTVPDWAQTTVAWGVQNKILGNAGTVRASDACTRAEAATMLVNLLG